MAQNELSHPLQVILDGTNYIIRAQSMRIFLESRNLWLYMTGDLKKPTKSPTELDEAFRTRLIDWESNHHQILMWSRNSTIPSISTMFGNFDDSKSAWDMLASRYSSTDGYGQTINDFFTRMQFLWGQLSLSDPSWKDPKDAQLYAARRDQDRLYQFLMALGDDFESIRGKLLHHTPLSSLDRPSLSLFERRLDCRDYALSIVIQYWLSHPLIPHHSPFKTRDNNYCLYCRRPGHY
jgi:hypothetical protein